MVTESTAESTRDKIKAASVEEFVDRGFDGARMQAIADRAGANKAMIYYYFQSKEGLFEVIIRETFGELFANLSNLRPERVTDLESLIREVVHLYTMFLTDHPYLPKIMVRELHAGHSVVRKTMAEMFAELKAGRYADLLHLVDAGVKTGQIRDVDPLQTIWNIVALNLFFFVARPALEAGWPELFQEKAEQQILAEREKAVADLILYGLVPRT
jgi:TetR/AcrR family transcriptional regulator